MGTRLYVGNLSYNVTEPELREAFGEGGRNVVEVKIVMDRESGENRASGTFDQTVVSNGAGAYRFRGEPTGEAVYSESVRSGSKRTATSA